MLICKHCGEEITESSNYRFRWWHNRTLDTRCMKVIVQGRMTDYTYAEPTIEAHSPDLSASR